jgi:hypothetical protein
MESPVFPRARKDGLTVRELPDETLVYDRERHRGHCLNAAAALVWRHCDGKTSVAELADIVARKLAVGDAAEVVGLALERLGRRHLLAGAPQPWPQGIRVSRREVLRKLALAAALPFVMTVATKTAAQSLSEALGPSDPPPPSPPVVVQVPVTITQTAPQPAKQTPPPPTPCRTRGQSCLAPVSGQQGTCCAGLRCNGVAQGAGVCG